MLGWRITISTQTPEERDHIDQIEQYRAAILATWETGIGGLDWIERLTAEGKASRLSGSGYPNRYTARADDVLPLIESGAIQPPRDGPYVFGIDEGEEYAQPPGWMGRIEVHNDRIAACPATQMLTIDAWDQS